MSVYFITGIDTGTGKSIVTGLLARSLIASGYRPITQKLVQTGCQGIAEDIQVHRSLAGISLLPEDIAGQTCRYVFNFPSSPHLAAELAHCTIKPALIDQDTHLLEENYSPVLIEGAGGLNVPLSDDYLISDFLAERRYPVILVCTPKLGSINHALMSLEIAANRKIPVTGIVFNMFKENNPVITANTRTTLLRYLVKYSFPPHIVDLPEFSIENPPQINFSPLLPGMVLT